MSASMMSHFLMPTRMYSQQPQSTKLEYGMPIIGNNYSGYKFLDLNALVFILCRMGSQLFQDGLTGKLEHFCPNQGNYYMLLMMRIIMDARL